MAALLNEPVTPARVSRAKSVDGGSGDGLIPPLSHTPETPASIDLDTPKQRGFSTMLLRAASKLRRVPLAVIPLPEQQTPKGEQQDAAGGAHEAELRLLYAQSRMQVTPQFGEYLDSLVPSANDSLAKQQAAVKAVSAQVRQTVVGAASADAAQNAYLAAKPHQKAFKRSSVHRKPVPVTSLANAGAELEAGSGSEKVVSEPCARAEDSGASTSKVGDAPDSSSRASSDGVSCPSTEAQPLSTGLEGPDKGSLSGALQSHGQDQHLCAEHHTSMRTDACAESPERPEPGLCAGAPERQAGNGSVPDDVLHAAASRESESICKALRPEVLQMEGAENASFSEESRLTAEHGAEHAPQAIADLRLSSEAAIRLGERPPETRMGVSKSSENESGSLAASPSLKAAVLPKSLMDRSPPAIPRRTRRLSARQLAEYKACPSSVSLANSAFRQPSPMAPSPPTYPSSLSPQHITAPTNDTTSTASDSARSPASQLPSGPRPLDLRPKRSSEHFRVSLPEPNSSDHKPLRPTLQRIHEISAVSMSLPPLEQTGSDGFSPCEMSPGFPYTPVDTVATAVDGKGAGDNPILLPKKLDSDFIDLSDQRILQRRRKGVNTLSYYPFEMLDEHLDIPQPKGFDDKLEQSHSAPVVHFTPVIPELPVSVEVQPDPSTLACSKEASLCTVSCIVRVGCESGLYESAWQRASSFDAAEKEHESRKLCVDAKHQGIDLEHCELGTLRLQSLLSVSFDGAKWLPLEALLFDNALILCRLPTPMNPQRSIQTTINLKHDMVGARLGHVAPRNIVCLELALEAEEVPSVYLTSPHMPDDMYQWYSAMFNPLLRFPVMQRGPVVENPPLDLVVCFPISIPTANLGQVIGQMHTFDRLGLVFYGQKMGNVSLQRESWFGWSALLKATNLIQPAPSETQDLSTVLDAAAEMIRARYVHPWMNAKPAIMVIGANVKGNLPESISNTTIPVHTICLDGQCDPRPLSSVARRTNGSFATSSLDKLGSVLAELAEQERAMSHDKTVLKLDASPSIVCNARGWQAKPASRPDEKMSGQSVEVQLGRLQAGVSRDVLVDLVFKPSMVDSILKQKDSILLKCRVSSVCRVSGVKVACSVSLPATLQLVNMPLPDNLPGIGYVRSPQVLLRRICVYTAERLEELTAHPGRGEKICDEVSTALSIVPIALRSAEPDGTASDSSATLDRLVLLSTGLEAWVNRIASFLSSREVKAEIYETIWALRRGCGGIRKESPVSVLFDFQPLNFL